MARTQPHPIGNDVKSNVLQLNLEELFQVAHEHMVRNTFPSASEGSNGDILVYDDGTNTYILIKTSRGWFRTAALTAI